MCVLDEGFEYEGKTFPSLTAIAFEITGAHWSGPRFFGLVRRTGAKDGGDPNSEAEATGRGVELGAGSNENAGREETADV